MDKFQRFQSVLKMEIKALEKTKTYIRKHSVEEAIKELSLAGRTIFTTGVGKCAPIADKMSQTLASYGIKSFFIHPIDAIHGDIGRIEKKDIFIIFSKSGNTPELIAFCNAVPDNPRILITENENSKLISERTTLLQIYIEEEGDPLNLAPMASTTAMLAVADGLCAALIEATGKTKEDFTANHPGGTLGKRLLCTVGDLMEIDPEYIPTIEIEDGEEYINFFEMLTAFSMSRYGAVFILKQEKVWGIFTDGDLRRLLKSRLNNLIPIEIKDLSHPPRTTTRDTLAIDALRQMEEESRITVMPVVDDGNRLVGAIHIHDLIKAGII